MPYTWKRKNSKVFLHSYKQNGKQSKTMANPETHKVGSSVQEELSFHREWFPSLKIICLQRKVSEINCFFENKNIKSCYIFNEY